MFSMGPILVFEAKLAARNKRLYLTRMIVGLLILGVALVARREAEALFESDGDSFRSLAQLGAAVFRATLVCQQFAVFLLTPAITAGAIADDRRRGILINLLASPLTNREIVLGKLIPRLLRAVMIALVGLPILLVTALLGGIEPMLIGATFAAGLAMIWMIAGASMFLSLFSDRARDAIVVVYVMEAVWLVAPSLLRPLIMIWWPGLQTVFWPVLRALEHSSPTGLVDLVMRPSGDWRPLGLLIGLELAVGLTLVAASVLLLRKAPPTVASSASRRGPLRLPRRRSRVGDDPMLWKELRVGRPRGSLRVAFLVLGIPLGLMYVEQLIDMAVPAYREVLAEGYGQTVDGRHEARDRLNTFLRDATGAMFTIWILACAASAAQGITSEKEENTWESLRSTPLTAREVLWGKRWGAVRRYAPLLVAMTFGWFVGLTAGGIHLLAFPFALLDLFVLGLFVTALGGYLSVVSRNSTVAATWCLALLLVINAGAIVLAVLLLDAGLGLTFVMPYQLDTFLASDNEIQTLFGRGVRGPGVPRPARINPVETIAAVILQAGAAWLLIARSEEILDARDAASVPRIVPPITSFDGAEQEPSETSLGEIRFE